MQFPKPPDAGYPRMQQCGRRDNDKQTEQNGSLYYSALLQAMDKPHR